MGSPQAFLSYTRTDDEFFGGAITGLRKALELGVRVVTGNRTFEIFQNVEGVELGQHWRERLAQALDEATFLIPILTPLFFSSEACREELDRFMDGEREVGRNDLILPIYFVTTPLLEKPGQIEKDRLASELVKRQRWDWRSLVDLPLTDPQVRREIRNVSEQIGRAVDRTRQVTNLAPALERERERQFKDNSEVVEKAAQPGRPERTRKVILWVDDNPWNVVYEQHALQRYALDSVTAMSTDEALQHLSRGEFHAVVSDMKRSPDDQAGYTLLQIVRDTGYKLPFFIYAGSKTPEHVAEAHRRGAQGTTNNPDELIKMVLGALRPEALERGTLAPTPG
ncbi:MAG TPA: TIR domain-containing protein [Myxococcales bacterium]|nr:TIR domain-containing protein [Myxococcales bacterium]